MTYCPDCGWPAYELDLDDSGFCLDCGYDSGFAALGSVYR
jgi:hypothetical protein